MLPCCVSVCVLMPLYRVSSVSLRLPFALCFALFALRSALCALRSVLCALRSALCALRSALCAIAACHVRCPPLAACSRASLLTFPSHSFCGAVAPALRAVLSALALSLSRSLARSPPPYRARPPIAPAPPSRPAFTAPGTPQAARSPWWAGSTVAAMMTRLSRPCLLLPGNVRAPHGTKHSSLCAFHCVVQTPLPPSSAALFCRPLLPPSSAALCRVCHRRPLPLLPPLSAAECQPARAARCITVTITQTPSPKNEAQRLARVRPRRRDQGQGACLA